MSFWDNILENMTSIQWEGAAMFIVIVMAIFAIARQYHILLISLLVIVIGWGVEDMMVMNIDTNRTLISLPLLIYIVGGVLIVILSLIEFFKTAIK